MTAELDFGGIFLSSVVGTAVIALIATMALRRVIILTGLYRHVWHPALFDAALFVLLWAVISALPLAV